MADMMGLKMMMTTWSFRRISLCSVFQPELRNQVRCILYLAIRRNLYAYIPYTPQYDQKSFASSKHHSMRRLIQGSVQKRKKEKKAKHRETSENLPFRKNLH